MSDRVDRDVINALIAGHFADPFSVLGMHRTEAGLEVRALLPHTYFEATCASFHSLP